MSTVQSTKSVKLVIISSTTETSVNSSYLNLLPSVPGSLQCSSKRLGKSFVPEQNSFLHNQQATFAIFAAILATVLMTFSLIFILMKCVKKKPRPILDIYEETRVWIMAVIG